MAVVSRITTLTLGGATGSRTWVSSVTTQDNPAGTSMTITTTETTSGVTPPIVSDTLTLRARIDNSSTNIISYTLTPGSASQTSTFVLTDTGAAGGSNRCGTVRLRIEAIKTTGLGTSQYNVNSDDATGEITPTGYAVTQRDQGWLRGTTTASIVINNTGLGNAAFTGTYAYPDTIFFRTTLAARAYGLTKTITNSVGGVQTNSVDDTVNVSGDSIYSSTFTNGVTATNYTAASTSRICTVSAVQNSDLAGVPFTVLTTITTQTITVDPRLTFTLVTRTSSSAVVNYGIHTVTGTFKVLNARSILMNSTTHGAFANMRVLSRDITGSVNEGQISASITPAGSPNETYSISYIFSGPTTQGNRGTGINGDTALHTIIGKIKGLSAHPTSDITNLFNHQTTFVSLSDLYRLDVHPQKTSTLVKDTDPYVSPGSGESIAFTIGADSLRQFGYVGDVNGAAIANASVKIALFDPSDTVSTEGEIARVTASGGGNTGWVTIPVNFNVLAPSGNWTGRIRIDIGDSGSNGNYGDTAPADVTGSKIVGSLTQIIPFISAYSADKDIDMQILPQVEPGNPGQILRFRYVNNSGTTLALDSEPLIRIYSIQSDGSIVTDMASTVATEIGTSNAYEVLWTTGLNIGNYLVEITGVFTAAPIRKVLPVIIKPFYAFDPTGGLFK